MNFHTGINHKFNLMIIMKTNLCIFIDAIEKKNQIKKETSYFQFKLFKKSLEARILF